MPDWFIQAAATGGPATTLIMVFMYWQERKRADRWEAKMLSFLEKHNNQRETVREALLMLKGKS